MKAVFMIEVGGRLVEVERRDIKPTMVFRKAIVRPIVAIQKSDDSDYSSRSIPDYEEWVCHSRPVGKRDFAVFLLDSAE